LPAGRVGNESRCRVTIQVTKDIVRHSQLSVLAPDKSLPSHKSFRTPLEEAHHRLECLPARPVDMQGVELSLV